MGFALDFLPREGSTGHRMASAGVGATARPPDTAQLSLPVQGDTKEVSQRRSGGAAPASCQARERLPCARAVPGSGACVLTSSAELPLCGGGRAAETPAEASQGQAWNSGTARAGRWLHWPAPPRVTLRPCRLLGPRLGPGLPRQDGRAGQTRIAGASRPLSRVPRRRACVLLHLTQHGPCATPPRPSQPGGRTPGPQPALPPSARRGSPGTGGRKSDEKGLQEQPLLAKGFSCLGKQLFSIKTCCYSMQKGCCGYFYTDENTLLNACGSV